MKTKIKIYSSLLVAFLTIAIGSATYAFYGSNGNQTDCPNPSGSGTISCVSFHNNGYTGSDGHHGTFQNGLSFATFNGYKDQETHDGRPFDERQFLYIESEQAMYPGRPYPSPWEDASDYNFAQGAIHTINFNGDESQKIGVWGYMHNNGIQNQYPSYNTNIRFSGWSESTAQDQHKPRFTISGSNTRPTSVWADVTINGSKAFTLTPTEAYFVREGDYDRTTIDAKPLTPGQLQSITSAGGTTFKSNASNNSGVFDSSHIHYVKIYLEFEATPSSGVCHSLNITDPSETLLYVDENGFIDENLAFTVDTDPNVVSGYQVLSTRDTITFDNTGQSDIQTNKTSMVMDGGPTTNEPFEMVQVWALDQNGNGIQACHDSFNIRLEEEEENACEVFNTIPTPPGTDTDPVPLNEFVTIDIETLLDTNGDPYLDNGAVPQIRYCYGKDEIQFLPDSGNAVIDSDGCAITLATDTMNVIAGRAGAMSIEVVGAERDCHDVFTTQSEEIEGICLALDIKGDFTSDDTTYSVNVETDPEGLDYQVEWFIDSTSGDGMSPVELDSNEIDLDDHNYNFTPGDTLVARATQINDPNNVCIDQLTSPEEECTLFELDRDTFEQGASQEVCIDYTDWPLDEGDDLEYSVDGGSTQSIELYDESGDLCFILTEDMVEDADRIVVWVPGWEEVCIDELEREVKPPEFDKNAKSSDSHAYSHRTIANFSDTYVDYRITYTHFNDEELDVIITDTIGTEDYIQGYIAGTQTDINSDTPLGGRIYYDNGSIHIFVDEDEIDNCDNTEDELCYDRNIGSRSGVEINNVPPRVEVVVEYRGEIVDSTVNPENCSNPAHPLWETGICGEIYPNTARFEDELDFEGRDDAEVIIPCPFIIIRAGGDVFLENPFDYGVDTLSCAEIRTADAPVITGTPPGDRDISKTGEDVSVLREFSERLCNSPGSTNIEGISSLICELELTSEELTQQAIVQSLSRNVQLFARYAKNLNGTPIVDGSFTLDRLSSTNDVYIKDDGMLTLGGTFADKARTIVVLNNDVYINKNLTFEDPQTLTDPRKVPSLAVIVIGGNIVIDPSVTQTEAIFFVQEGEDSKGGQICEAPTKTKASDPSKFCIDDTSLVDWNSTNRLTHYGSIYGDIQHLLKYRVKSGDPTKEEGAILIRFDNRIYLNTPPLLNKLIDVTQKAF